MHYLLFYEKVPDYSQREPAFQTAHREHVLAAVARGDLLLGGPLEGSVDGANVLLFQAESPVTAESFATADPYVKGGVVCRWHVRPWRTVVGKDAACPLPN